MLSKTVFPALKPSTVPTSSSATPNLVFRRGWANTTSTIAGSAYVEVGGSKVVAYAYAPRASTGRNCDFINGELEFKVSFASHLDIGRGGECSATGGNRGGDIYDNIHDLISLRDANTCANEKAHIERLLSITVKDALKDAIILKGYPKTILGMTIVIMQSSVQDLSAVINAATLAFADAAVEMRDLVTSYTVEQELEGDILPFYCTVALMGDPDYTTLVQTRGTRSPQMLLATIALTKQQCLIVRQQMSEYLKESFQAK